MSERREREVGIRYPWGSHDAPMTPTGYEPFEREVGILWFDTTPARFSQHVVRSTLESSHEHSKVDTLES